MLPIHEFLIRYELNVVKSFLGVAVAVRAIIGTLGNLVLKNSKYSKLNNKESTNFSKTNFLNLISFCKKSVKRTISLYLDSRLVNYLIICTRSLVFLTENAKSQRTSNSF